MMENDLIKMTYLRSKHMHLYSLTLSYYIARNYSNHVAYKDVLK